VAADLPDDPVDGGKSQPGSLIHFLSGKDQSPVRAFVCILTETQYYNVVTSRNAALPIC
jgi:hypothetical protein